MRLLYATSLTFPSGLANRIQTLAMSREFNKKLGEDFYLGVGKIDGSDVKEKNKDIKIINFDVTKSYILAFRYFKFIRTKRIEYIYCREPRLMLFLVLYSKIFFMRSKLIYEMHELAERNILEKFINWIFARMSSRIVFVTNSLRCLYIKKYKFSEEKTLVAPDGVNLEIFDIGLTIEKARERLNLPQEKKIIGFFGRFKTMEMDKGLEDILKSLKILNENVLLLAMGGKSIDIEYYSNRAKELGVYHKVMFVEHLSQNEVAIRQQACDLLLMPFPYSEHFAYYMSPLKMFEYMASKRPILTSNLPSTLEVLNENNSVLVKPDDPEDLARGVNKILEDQNLAQKISEKAFLDVQSYTWSKRAEKIINFIQ